MQLSRQPEEPLLHVPPLHQTMCDKRHLAEALHLSPTNEEVVTRNKGAHHPDHRELPAHLLGHRGQAIALQHQVEVVVPEAAALHQVILLLLEAVRHRAVHLHEAVDRAVVLLGEVEDRLKIIKGISNVKFITYPSSSFRSNIISDHKTIQLPA